MIVPDLRERDLLAPILPFDEQAYGQRKRRWHQELSQGVRLMVRASSAHEQAVSGVPQRERVISGRCEEFVPVVAEQMGERFFQEEAR